MKNTLFLISFFSLILFSCGDDDALNFTIDCLPSNLQSDVIAMYSFSGSSLVDDSGNGNALSNSTSAKPAPDKNGNPDCAFAFDQSSQTEFLNRTDASFLNSLDQFSVSLWYMPLDTTKFGAQYEILLSRGDEKHCPDRRGEWSVGMYDCRRAVFGHNNAIWANPVSEPFVCQTEINMLVDKWHHLVAVYDNDNYTLYFDGALQGIDTGASNCGTNYIAEDKGELFLGKNFQGVLDDVIIYKKALLLNEVTELLMLRTCLKFEKINQILFGIQ